VPDLQKRRAEVVRIFSRMLGPLGFNVSLAPPLSAAPLVDAALGVLELAAGPIAFDRASRLLRSPFVAGAEREMAARARLDVALRRVAPGDALAHAAARPHRHRVQTAPRARLPAARRRPRWLAGSGEAVHPRGPARLGAALHGPARGGRIPGRAHARFGRVPDAHEVARGHRHARDPRLRGACLDARPRHARASSGSRPETTFQPASGTAPVQVLGVLESAGLAFDHLWVSGLTDDAWPLAARPQPLIPIGLQRKAGVPQATPERSLAFDAGLTAAWREAAPEVVFSSAHAEGDRELLVSALVADVAAVDAAALSIPAFATRRDALFAAGPRILAPSPPGSIVPRRPSRVRPRAARASSSTQAACPFRAFAHHRLAAREMEHPEPGLGPAERGTAAARDDGKPLAAAEGSANVERH
jgi:hypothetical protein